MQDAGETAGELAQRGVVAGAAGEDGPVITGRAGDRAGPGVVLACLRSGGASGTDPLHIGVNPAYAAMDQGERGMNI